MEPVSYTHLMEKFGLELESSKSRLIEFGRFAEQNRRARGECKPETFDFCLLYTSVLYDLLVSAAASVGTEQMSTGHLVPLLFPLPESVNTGGTVSYTHLISEYNGKHFIEQMRIRNDKPHRTLAVIV